MSAAHDGFDVHCAVRIAADDDAGRERLVRYCTRPPFALERIELLRDGRIAYLLKAPRKGRTHRVMTPMDFMARLAALIPPPRIPLARYHGVFAPRSSWRAMVTPKPPARACLSKAAAPAPGSTPAPASPASPAPVSPAPASPALLAPAPASPAPASEPSAFVWSPVPGPISMGVAQPCTGPVLHTEPTTITVAHWGRLNEGERFAKARYVDWAVLMKRSFGFEVLSCPRCATKMCVLATITHPATIRRILGHLGVRAEPLAPAPARDRTWEQLDLDAA